MICMHNIIIVYEKLYIDDEDVEDDRPIHCIHFKSTKRDPHKSNKGLQVQPITQVAFDCILFGKSSLPNSYT